MCGCSFVLVCVRVYVEGGWRLPAQKGWMGDGRGWGRHGRREMDRAGSTQGREGGEVDAASAGAWAASSSCSRTQPVGGGGVVQGCNGPAHPAPTVHVPAVRRAWAVAPPVRGGFLRALLQLTVSGPISACVLACSPSPIPPHHPRLRLFLTSCVSYASRSSCASCACAAAGVLCADGPRGRWP